MRWGAARDAYEASLGDAALLRQLGIDTPDAPNVPWDDLPRRKQVEWLEGGRNNLYRRLAGEVEARNVETRMDWTPEQRRDTPPWHTEDVPRDQQIVRRTVPKKQHY